MNPALIQLIVSAISKLFQGGMTAAFMRPSQALPLDYTSEARGQPAGNREYMMSRDKYGLGTTNRGRLLLPKDAVAFDRLERGPYQWEHRQPYAAKYPGRVQARIDPPTPYPVFAGAPGRPDVPVQGAQAWALHRLRQAQDAGLIGQVPTPDDRDLGAEWRKVSALLAQRARREGFNLTRRLED